MHVEAMITSHPQAGGQVNDALAHCIEACRACAHDCEQHANTHRHCRICAETCRDCERASRSAQGTVAIAHQ